MDLSHYTPKKKILHKHLLSLEKYSTQDICEILSLAIKLKADLYKGKKHLLLKGKTLAMIFAKSSTRTRISFEQGIKQLGGTAMILNANDIQLGRGETIHDTAKVLNGYNIDGVMIRTFKQDDVEQLAKYGNFSVINALTDDFHPCQALADLLTVYEVFGRLEGIKLAYFGDGNNVAHSLLLAGAKMGMEVVCCSPLGYEPNPRIVESARAEGNAYVTADIDEAINNTSVIYTDVFFSMGQDKNPEKEAALMPYQVNEALMSKANKDAIFLHCLPAHRSEEVTAGVIDSPASVVFKQAENRLHVQKAVMALLMK